MRAWGRLLRLSLAPTAAADIAAGIVLGNAGWSPRITLLVLASLCVYHGGMALNDWAARPPDAESRPDRPIPSGRIAASSALAVAVLLLASGPAIAALVAPRSAWVLAGVSLAAAAYDLGVRGPFLLALCRAGNLAAGILAAPFELDTTTWLLPAAAYGGYVAAVSALARLEDADAQTVARARPGIALRIAGLLLLIAPLAAGAPNRVLGLAAGFAVAAAGAWGLFAVAGRRAPWTNAEVCRAVGFGLRRLLVFTSALTLARGTVEAAIVGGAILLGYPIAYALRGVFPPS
jgi:4-hydroxybenzoate polyprenyltransferase